MTQATSNRLLDQITKFITNITNTLSVVYCVFMTIYIHHSSIYP